MFNLDMNHVMSWMGKNIACSHVQQYNKMSEGLM